MKPLEELGRRRTRTRVKLKRDVMHGGRMVGVSADKGPSHKLTVSALTLSVQVQRMENPGKAASRAVWLTRELEPDLQG